MTVVKVKGCFILFFILYVCVCVVWMPPCVCRRGRDRNWERGRKGLNCSSDKSNLTLLNTRHNQTSSDFLFTSRSSTLIIFSFLPLAWTECVDISAIQRLGRASALQLLGRLCLPTPLSCSSWDLLWLPEPGSHALLSAALHTPHSEALCACRLRSHWQHLQPSVLFSQSSPVLICPSPN